MSAMRSPPTREGQVWLHKYRECFMHWTTSRSEAALEEAVSALKSLFERCPDYAHEVACIAATGCFGSRRIGAPHLIARLADCGLQASGMASSNVGDVNARAILLLSLAEAHLYAENRIEGLAALRRLETQFSNKSPDNPLQTWILGRMHALTAELQELALENELAARSYQAAKQLIGPLLSDRSQGRHFVKLWSEALLWQGGGESDLLVNEKLALLELSNLASSSAIGFARTLGDKESRETRAEAAREAWQALEAYGSPPDLSPFRSEEHT